MGKFFRLIFFTTNDNNLAIFKCPMVNTGAQINPHKLPMRSFPWQPNINQSHSLCSPLNRGRAPSKQDDTNLSEGRDFAEVVSRGKVVSTSHHTKLLTGKQYRIWIYLFHLASQAVTRHLTQHSSGFMADMIVLISHLSSALWARKLLPCYAFFLFPPFRWWHLFGLKQWNATWIFPYQVFVSSVFTFLSQT